MKFPGKVVLVMKHLLFFSLTLTLIFALTVLIGAQPKPASRSVKGQVLTSTDMPAVKIEFAKAFKYIGAQSFVLYDVANAEQHFFVDADQNGRMKRFYWVQFEGYLPTNTHSYNYKSPKVVNAGGLDFFADANARSLNGIPGRADSDSARARAFFEKKGLRMLGTELISQRLVHLVDQAKRNELMIIYVEDLTGTGLNAADLSEGGSARGRWPEISQGLLDRALKNMKVKK
ncbi:MAG TPA: hypothetical protein VJV21_04765 [Pyrinomonadaceae bacterium]|nr:hypothetical protein [Pyrinomonadaceae bacterium]